MRFRVSLPPETGCPCGSGLAYGQCCLEPVTYVTRRVVQTLTEAVPTWDRIDLPIESLGLIVGLKPAVGEVLPTVEEITEAVEGLVEAILNYPEGVAHLDEGLRDLLWESELRVPADRLSDFLVDRILDADPEAEGGASASGELIADCLRPHLTEEFAERVHWALVRRARRAGTGRRVLTVVVWALWNLHQDLPIAEDAVWDGIFRVSLAELWSVAADGGDGMSAPLEELDGKEASTDREDIIRLRERAEEAVRALVAGDLNMNLPLFSIVNGALKMRKLMSDPDYPGYDALFDARSWGSWREHPITRHMRTPMKKDWPHFLPAFESVLDRWLESDTSSEDCFVASIMAMYALLECHGLPELDDVLAIIYTSCVRDALTFGNGDPGVSAILEKDYVKLLRYALDLQEWGRPEAARHVRRSLLKRSSDID